MKTNCDNEIVDSLTNMIRQSEPPIALVGMMGCGKTAVGQSLAHQLNCPFVDLDFLIEQAAEKPIERIFEEDGEPEFRRLESYLLQKESGSGLRVISTGGGAFVSPENRQYLLSSAFCVYLKASVETLWERVRHSTHRPLLKKEDPETVMINLLASRTHAYEKAHEIVEVDTGSPSEIAQLILDKYRRVCAPQKGAN